MQKNALVLSGGGARGAYEVGVWQALIELDFPIHIVTGTSVGALNAGMIAAGDFERTRELWKNIRTDMIFAVEIDDSLPLKQKINAMVRQFLRDYAHKGGIESYPLKQLLDEYCDETAVRKSGIACGIVCVDKRTLKPKEIYADEIAPGELNEYLVASSSLYPVIKSHEIGGAEYIDGGYYDNMPVELALKKGADMIIAVDLRAAGVVRKDTLRLPQKMMYIRSYWDLGQVLVFDSEQIARNIRLGYLDTMREFGAFEGIAYTFLKGSANEMIRRYRKEILALNAAAGLTMKRGMPHREELFLLRIKAFLDHKYGRDYSMRYPYLLRACMESAGEICGLDPQKIYSAERFNACLMEKANQLELQVQIPNAGMPLKSMRQTLSLLDKSVRTAYFAVMMKRAAMEGKPVELWAASLFLPEELLGAYYLALIS